ncbi:MAG TPA: SRPBCC domain-containing protein, partial [Deltaproteobacteria bacterium]|nr:SRPBCC domain-containing protein [Deltaproteobacteria bacterium]
AKGEARLGGCLKVHFQPAGRTWARVFWPRLITVKPGRELRWLGRPRIPGIFDIDHYWIINPCGDGRIHLLHGTAIIGLLAPIFEPMLQGSTRRAFIAMNRAHKKRAEQGPR